ncbi:hypothetical protein Tco_0670867 [Tanacetum coccineum]
MILQEVLMSSGLKTINTARSRAPVNAPKPKAVHNVVKRNRFHDVKCINHLEDDLEDTSKEGRKITEIDQDPGISLVQHDVEIQGRHKHELEFDLDAVNIPVTTAGAEISTANPEVKTTGDSIEDIATETLVYIRRSAAKAKDKGKAKMEESESAMTKTKRQQEQERLGFEVAVRLQAEIDKEERQRISRAEGLIQELL